MKTVALILVVLAILCGLSLKRLIKYEYAEASFADGSGIIIRARLSATLSDIPRGWFTTVASHGPYQLYLFSNQKIPDIDISKITLVGGGKEITVGRNQFNLGEPGPLQWVFRSSELNIEYVDYEIRFVVDKKSRSGEDKIDGKIRLVTNEKSEITTEILRRLSGI